MSRYAVSEKVDNKNSAGDKKHSSFSVNIIALSVLDVTGYCPGQVGHTLDTQLLFKILLRRKGYLSEESSKKKSWLINNDSVRIEF